MSNYRTMTGSYVDREATIKGFPIAKVVTGYNSFGKSV